MKCSEKHEDVESISQSRFMREGEAEKEMRFSTPALAEWTDASQTRLRCPLCGVEEEIG